jgi:hypothetical protein
MASGHRRAALTQCQATKRPHSITRAPTKASPITSGLFSHSTLSLNRATSSQAAPTSQLCLLNRTSASSLSTTNGARVDSSPWPGQPSPLASLDRSVHFAIGRTSKTRERCWACAWPVTSTCGQCPWAGPGSNNAVLVTAMEQRVRLRHRHLIVTVTHVRLF